MPRRVTDPRTAAFIDFFKSQGVKFVDVESGEEIIGSGDNRSGSQPDTSELEQA